jgi:hypothetical protein
MSNDRDGDKPVITNNNYNVSVDGNRVHHTIREDDYKITVTIEVTQAKENSEKRTKEDKED